MQVTKQDTLPTPPPKLPKVHPLEPWRDVPYVCMHCGRTLRNYAAKNVHLAHCKKRILSRFFKCKNLLFVVQWNPLKKRAASLNRLISEFHDPKLVIGALNFLSYEGIVKRYIAMELDKSPEMAAYIDGAVQFPVIRQKLTDKEFMLFTSNVTEMERIRKAGIQSEIVKKEDS